MPSRSPLLSLKETMRSLGLPRQCSGKEFTCQCRDTRDAVLPLGQEDPLEWVMATRFSILAWVKCHWQRRLVSHSSWDPKESDATERLSTHAHVNTHTHTHTWDDWYGGLAALGENVIRTAITNSAGVLPCAGYFGAVHKQYVYKVGTVFFWFYRDWFAQGHTW